MGRVVEGLEEPLVGIRLADGAEADQVPLAGIDRIMLPDQLPEMLAERLCSLLENPDLCRAMGQANRRLAVERFDIAISTRRMIALLKGQHPASAA